MKGYKSIAFFGLALVIAAANLFGFGGFEMSASQQEIFSIVVPLIGLALRYITTSEIFKPE